MLKISRGALDSGVRYRLGMQFTLPTPGSRDRNPSPRKVDRKRFPNGFQALLERAAHWGTRLAIWMSPFGGYMTAGQHRLRFGKSHGYEATPGGQGRPRFGSAPR